MMNKVLSFLLMLMVATCSVTLQSCHSDDDPAAPWSPTKANPILSGVITTNGGMPLAGATVSANGQTAVTDQLGFYQITGLTPGTSIVKVSLDDNYSTKMGKVALAENAVSIFNAVLIKAYNIVTAESNAIDPTSSDAEIVDAIYSTETPTPTASLSAEHQTMFVIIRNIHEAFQLENDELLLSSNMYVEENSSRAVYGEGITTLTSKTMSGQPLKGEVKIAVKSEAKPVKVVHNGKDVTDSIITAENGNCHYFNTSELGTTEFHFSLSISSVKEVKKNLTFSQIIIEGPESAKTVTYDYKVGSEITTNPNSVLAQFVTLINGAANYQTKTGEVEVTKIPAGAKVMVSGYQKNTTTKYYYTNKTNFLVTSVAYGDTQTKTSDTRQHTGGSN